MFEPLAPVGLNMFQLPTKKLPMQEMISWLIDNQNNTVEGAEIHESTLGEDIPIPYDLECFEGLISRISSLALQVAPKGFKLGLERLWGQVQHTGQCCAYHDHASLTRGPNPYDLSFVFYLQASAEHGDLEFPMYIHGVNYTKRLSPRTGNLAIFQSHLPHFTRKNAKDTPRVVVSGNYVALQ